MTQKEEEDTCMQWVPTLLMKQKEEEDTCMQWVPTLLMTQKAPTRPPTHPPTHLLPPSPSPPPGKTNAAPIDDDCIALVLEETTCAAIVPSSSADSAAGLKKIPVCLEIYFKLGIGSVTIFFLALWPFFFSCTDSDDSLKKVPVFDISNYYYFVINY
jgi:hypothetical protein